MQRSPPCVGASARFSEHFRGTSSALGKVSEAALEERSSGPPFGSSCRGTWVVPSDFHS